MMRLDGYREGFLNFIEKTNHNSKDKILELLKIYDESKTVVGLPDYNLENKSDILFLDLSNQNLKELPTDFSELNNLLILDLSENKKIDLKNIGSLKSLKIIFLEECEIEEIPIEFGNLTDLITINLNENKLNNLPETFGNLENLIGLNLSNNEFSEIPKCFSKLTNLLGLYLDFNKFSNITEDFCKIIKINFLELSNNEIISIDNCFGNLINLQRLDLSGNKIVNFEWLANLTKLQSLILNDLSLESFPNEIVNLINLEHLDLSSNNLKSLSNDIKNLSKIEDIDLSNNQFKKFPTEICKLTEIESLDLSRNEISKLPDDFINLTNLKNLILDNNKFCEFPKVITNLNQLVQIGFAFNKLHEIPDEIGNLTNLELLNLLANKLKYLSPSIGKCSKLRDLLLDLNELDEYPVEIADLKCLNRLSISRQHKNPLTKMPEIKKFGLLEIIEYLNIRRGIQKYSTFWDIPDDLKTGFQQFLAFFADFVKKLTGENINLQVNRIKTGLQLITEATPNLTIEQIDLYLTKYIDLFSKQSEELISTDELEKISRQQAFELRQLYRDVQYEKQNLERKIQDQFEKIIFLKDTIAEKNEAIKDLHFNLRTFTLQNSQLLQLALTNNTKNKFDISVSLVPQQLPEKSSKIEFDPDKFLVDLIQKCIRMVEKKGVEKLEDLRNNDISVYLREHHYFAYDQTQSGISDTNFGELDILIREDKGTPVCILEAFNLKSAGPLNKEISSHIDKLIHKYDTIGHEVNFILVYALASNFSELWKNYTIYMQDLNNKPDFENKYELISFTETAKSNKANLKIGLALHNREGKIVKVYHLFLDMYSKINN